MNDDTAFSDLRNDSNSCVKLKTGTTYYDPLHLAVGASTEASELLDIFRCKQAGELEGILDEKRNEVRGELADTSYYFP